jgi:hypothetical protein
LFIIRFSMAFQTLIISSIAYRLVWIPLQFNCFLIIPHNISIGFRSGELAGQPGQRKHSYVISARFTSVVCAVAPSWTRTHGLKLNALCASRKNCVLSE